MSNTITVIIAEIIADIQDLLTSSDEDYIDEDKSDYIDQEQDDE